MSAAHHRSARLVAGAEVEIDEPDYKVAVADSTFVLLWRGAATPERARLVCAAISRRAAHGRFVAITVVEENAPPPEGPARQIFAATMREIRHSIAGNAYFMPISGFRGSVIRSVITGLNLLAGDPYPTRAFDALPPAARWVAGRLHDDAAAADVLARRLQSQVEGLRALT
jgi:hypothetical protein